MKLVEDITEFVGLRSKLYSFKMDEDTVKKCKGVKKTEANSKEVYKFRRLQRHFIHR